MQNAPKYCKNRSERFFSSLSLLDKVQCTFPKMTIVIGRIIPQDRRYPLPQTLTASALYIHQQLQGLWFSLRFLPVYQVRVVAFIYLGFDPTIGLAQWLEHLS